MMSARRAPGLLLPPSAPVSGTVPLERDRRGITSDIRPTYATPPLAPAAPAAMPGTKPRILLVEDEPALRRALTKRLHGQYEVVVAEDGATAADLVAEQSFDVVLTDVGLPIVNGVELLRIVRSLDTDAQVVLMTANPTLDTEVVAIELGATCIHKPYEPRLLDAALERASKLASLARTKRDAANEARRAQPKATTASRASAFERALDSVTVVFQPIVDRRTRGTAGFEVLMRTGEPMLPSPTDVLAAAEKLDRMHELGRRIRDLAAASFRPASNALLFVNLHPADLMDPKLYDPDAPLTRMAERVVLEITERASLDDAGEVQRLARKLRGLGFQIAVDDLGAGYAGLSTVAALEPEFVKLDMSLVRGIESSPVRGHLVKCMTDLCRDLDMKVVAEGIESHAELARLLEIGCDYLQGFLLGRPQRDPIASRYGW